MQLREFDASDIDGTVDNMKRLARGPDKRVVRYSGCLIGGHRFRTIDRDKCRATQNSGLVVKAEHGGEEINFYGVLRDVFELSYGGEHQKVFVFKCDWWDLGSRSRFNTDEFKILSIRASKTWYKNDPYVLAAQAEEVVYLPDPKMGKGWVVVERVPPRNLYDVQVTKPVVDTSVDDAYQQNECVGDFDINLGEEFSHTRRTDMDGQLVSVSGVAINEGVHCDSTIRHNGSSTEDSDGDS